MITCLACNPSIDKTFEVERIALGEIHRPLAFTQVAGGKAINQARAAAALGAEVEIVLLAGGHAGRWIVGELERRGVEAKVVEAASETRSSLSVLDRDAGQMTEFYEAGAKVGASKWEELEAAVRTRLARSSPRWVSMAGSLPPGAPVDGYRRMLEIAAGKGALTALDTAGEPLQLGLEGKPTLVKVNAAEAGELLGVEIVSLPTACETARHLAKGGGVSAITRGQQAAVLCADGVGCWYGAPPSLGSYPVGSGDSFMSGILTGRERGLDWPSTLTFALGVAAANAEVPGPASFQPARAEELASRVTVKPL